MTDVFKNYSQVMFGGLYGVATIVVAVLSLTSNIINKKYIGFKVNELFRYKIIFSFFPLIYLLTINFLIMFNEKIYYTKNFIFNSVILFVYIIIFCSYCVAQPILDSKRFKKTIIIKTKKKFKNEINRKKISNTQLLGEIKELFSSLKEDTNSIFDIEEQKQLFKDLTIIVRNQGITNHEIKEIFELSIKHFGENIGLEVCDSFDFYQKYIGVTSEKLELNDDNSYYYSVSLFHSFMQFMYNDNIEMNEEAILTNRKQMIHNEKYFVASVKYLKDSNFVLSDAIFLSEIILSYFIIYKHNALIVEKLPPQIKDYFEDIVFCISNDNYNWNKKHDSSEKNEAFQSAFNILKGGRVCE